ncbi:uncharacterized protein B0H18DRAFT_1087796 [Fomitopsis serialis]|uniref:uncharacterized protein n=1 Tax=Fomitopsis serialis TaxID=139415 RepID=UPI0020086472|nr:uncharacterized protein B0H18DRAFT_1087796 [Neoantrodia serialis]KAH9914483.1 hypothetical protein B0H18DRAFT_1087796 [Neoantrodia serialis]
MDATDSGTPFGPLLLTVHDAIFEVVLVCSAGYILARKGILDKPTQGRAFATAAGMFMNSNTLPIALMQSLVITEMLGRALTYVPRPPSGAWDDEAVFPVLRATILSQVRWSYGVRLLSKADPEPVAEPVETVYSDSAEPPPEGGSDDTPVAITNDRGRTDFFLKLCAPATQSPARPAPTSSIWQSHRRRLGNRLRELWKVFCERMKMPFWAALAALVFACISPLQRTLAHIECIRGALDMAGDCSIPLTLVVQGAYFYTPATDLRGRRRSRGETGNGERRPGGSKIVGIAVLSRWILAPAATKENWQPVFEDPVVVVHHVLLLTSPLPRVDAFERLLSRTVFWSYCVVTPSSMIAVVVVGLLLTKL